MEDILSQMSFDEGIAMPIANQENKQYEAEVYIIQFSCSQLKPSKSKIKCEIILAKETIHSLTVKENVYHSITE